ncbi:MAG: DUF4345 family protein [Planctomycetota bacterium]
MISPPTDPADDTSNRTRNSLFAIVTVCITAGIWLGFAVFLGFMPETLLRTFGVDSQTPQMLTEIRAFYGGVEFGIAATMILLWRKGQIPAALCVGGIPLIGSATGRVLGLWVDGWFFPHLTMATVEYIGAAMCILGIWLQRKSRRSSG